MTIYIENPATLYDAYISHCEFLKFAQRAAITDVTAALRTALIRYTLPKFGFPFAQGKKLTQDEINKGLELMKQIPISELNHLIEYQQEVFESLGGVSSSRTYRMHLKKMQNWCRQQPWWSGAANPNSEPRSPRIRLKRGRVGDNIRVTDKKLTPRSPHFKYALTASEISPALQLSSDNFLTFQTAVVGSRKRQDGRLRECSAMGHVKTATRILGWLHRYKGIPLEALSLETLVSSSGLTPEGHRDEAALDEIMNLVDEHLQWLREEREASPNTELKAVEALVAVAKFLYHKQSKCQSRHQVANKRVGYRDIPVIEEFRRLECEIMARVNTTPRRSDESKKWLDWPVFLACVQRIKAECAPRVQCGNKRTIRTIAQCHQVALIFILLSAFPDRGRTIRELEVGRTLINRDGKWFVEQMADDFKTGDSHCKDSQRRIIELPAALYPLLEEWLYKWRATFKPNHPYMLTQLNGKPVTATSLYQYFRKRAYRLTGQAFTPHMTRDSIVTHLKLSGASEQVLAALADLMAHSPEMQRKIYDRRTPQQKVAPALEALQSLPAGTLPPPPMLKVIQGQMKKDDSPST